MDLIDTKTGAVFSDTKTQGGGGWLFSPSLSVHYRIFGLTPHMEPVERDDKVKSDASVVIDIVVMYFIHLEH